MTYDELLKEAVSGITVGKNTYWAREPQVATCAFLQAIACLLLAKELRENQPAKKVCIACDGKGWREMAFGGMCVCEKCGGDGTL